MPRRTTSRGMVRRTARRAYYPPARRRNGVSKSRYAKAEASLKRARQRTRTLQSKYSREGVIWTASGFIVGAAVSGALGAAIDTTWMGVDMRLVIAGAGLASSFFIEDPMMTNFVAAGSLAIGATAISETVDEALSGVFGTLKA